jgi:hypothetical protein
MDLANNREATMTQTLHRAMVSPRLRAVMVRCPCGHEFRAGTYPMSHPEAKRIVRLACEKRHVNEGGLVIWFRQLSQQETRPQR